MDFWEIHQIQPEFQHYCEFKAQIHPLVQVSLQQMLSEEFQKEKWSQIKIEVKEWIQLSAYKLTQSDEKKLIEALGPWGLTLKVQHRILPRPELVKVKLLFAELSRSHSQNLGFTWEQNYQAHLLPGQDLIGNWTVKLNALEMQGQGKILASPTLIAESGGTAEFLAGGEFPIRNRGYINNNVSWKKHGLSFQIKPTVDDSQRIFLKLESEVSMLDSTSEVEGIPGLKVSRLLSQFNLENKQTIILSGLIQERYGQSQDLLPWLGSLPVLGRLFSSHNFQNEKSDLIILVQTEIYNSTAQTQFPESEWSNENSP